MSGTSQPDAQKPAAPPAQPNAWGSIGAGTMGATVMMWTYKSHFGAEMPADVANSITGLFIMGVHAIQHAVFAYLQWKKGPTS